VGGEIGLKTSTAFIAPELAAALYHKQESRADLELELKQNKQQRNEEEELVIQDLGKLDRLNARNSEIGLALQQLRLYGSMIPQKPLASTKFDVWSFGVVMYEMLCNRSRQCTLPVYLRHEACICAPNFNHHFYNFVCRGLFHRDIEDNLVPTERKRLATWTGLKPEELALVLDDCTDATDDDKAAACELLVQCLQSKPELRPTMESVLKLAFFNGRTADMQLLHEDMRRVEHKIDAIGDALEKAKVLFLTILNLGSDDIVRTHETKRPSDFSTGFDPSLHAVGGRVRAPHALHPRPARHG
jgi:serine/threonine protein kinase